MASIKFRIEHHPDATHAHKYRYAIVHGKNVAHSQGYPTHQHATRAVEGLWEGFAKAMGFGTVKEAAVNALAGNATPLVPYTTDSLKPDERG